ncbi:hypothetical protein PIROE2DRAFT_4326 [Piromyces sp. E2]|nr:hypothetical protein PIROE2DRAFT_4326 [Piromyces sp. E2]|eukprot:OUM68042.1 hypothetical protein PIROE2DRAFT_4326 [Piromyces sp. E2]
MSPYQFSSKDTMVAINPLRSARLSAAHASTLRIRKDTYLIMNYDIGGNDPEALFMLSHPRSHMVCDVLPYRNDFGAINLLSKANMEWFVSLTVACGPNRTPLNCHHILIIILKSSRSELISAIYDTSSYVYPKPYDLLTPNP